MKKKVNVCKNDSLAANISYYKKNIKNISNNLVKSFNKKNSIKHAAGEKIPSKEFIIAIIEELEIILFPGYFGDQNITDESLGSYISINIYKIFDKLVEQIAKSYRHQCASDHYTLCINCQQKSLESTYNFISKLVRLRELFCDDIKAAFDGDPAAKNIDEIVFSYPGFKAVFIHRIAHELYKMNIPLIPRIMAEYAHSITGIDIHPGATIGRSFFIDHGTGVVIGETCVIGNNVKVYQGVTLGALSVPKTNLKTDEATLKRHPTIEDDCVLYSGATILGGNTIIGKGSIIGGNVWLTHSVEPFSKVMSQQYEFNKYSKGKLNHKK